MSLAVVLPGRAFPVTMPLLQLAVAALERHGHEVRTVSWSPGEVPDDPAAWVTERLLDAAPEGCDLLVAKSLGCWASAHAAERGVPAMWLTPVLTRPDVAAGIRANPAPQLVVGGLADPMHDARVAAGLGCDVLELDGADHALSRTGDAELGDVAGEVETALDDWLARLGRLG